MKKIILQKKRYAKIKRRIQLGVDKPGDIDMLKKLHLELNYQRKSNELWLAINK